MKNKILVLFLILSMISLSLVATVALPEHEKKRAQQHLEQKTITAKCTHDDSLFCTHLPLISITTGGKEIPGSPVKVADGVYEYTTSENGEKTISVAADVFDSSNSYNHLTDTPAIKSLANIRIRGNSSRFFDKKSYQLNFIHEDGRDKDVEFLGMKANSKWVLNGPFLDKTLLRNYMCYNIGGKIMDWAPNVRFCECFIDGKYMGVYLAVETINYKSMGLTKYQEDTGISSYILRMDMGDNEAKHINTYTDYTLRSQSYMTIEYPARKDLTPKVKKTINDEFSAFEKVLYSYDYNSKDYGYKNFIDVDSFVEYFIINEFTCNVDAGELSTYIYKDALGKYKMAIWDFNSSCNAYRNDEMKPNRFVFQTKLWYFMLMKDEAFTDRIISKYRELRKTYLSDEYLLNYIDQVSGYLGDAVERNYEVWGYSFGKEHDFFIPAERNPRSYEQAIEQLKSFVVRRGEWMDKNIELLRLYSHKSMIKKYTD